MLSRDSASGRQLCFSASAWRSHMGRLRCGRRGSGVVARRGPRHSRRRFPANPRNRQARPRWFEHTTLVARVASGTARARATELRLPTRQLTRARSSPVHQADVRALFVVEVAVPRRAWRQNSAAVAGFGSGGGWGARRARTTHHRDKLGAWLRQADRGVPFVG